MRLIVLLASALIGATILYSQAPETAPAPLRSVFATVESKAAATIAQAPKLFAKRPHAALIANLPQGSFYFVVGLAGLLVAGAALLPLLRSRRRETAPPSWIVTARASAPESRKPAEHQAECTTLEKALVPDIRARGTASLAKAHQLDLYWRFVGRSKRIQFGSASGSEFDDFKRFTLTTLRAIAPATSERAANAFHEVKSSLSVLPREDNLALRRFYGAVESRQREEAAAWKEARAAIAAKPAEQEKCLAAMERLRQLHRDMAKDAASLVGDIEVSIRAVV